MRLSDRHKRMLSLIGFPLSLALLGGLAFSFRAELFGLFRSAESIRGWVAERGALGPAAFVGLQALQVIVFVIPGEVVQVAGGFAFGLLGGTLWSVVGILLGSLFNFGVGRALGRPFAVAVLGADTIERIDASTKGGRAAAGFLLLFAIPGIPKDALTYAAGASRLSFGAFIAVSTIGRLPGIVGTSYMGSAVFEQDYAAAIVVVSISAVLLFLGLVFRERLHGFVERVISRRRRR
ncbi:MAG: VTT domain-containing protein [Spirochaetes bacterium]|nr:VTT domain-containing protein [Spirochaetota bacterium]MBU1079229.1 VTT domain-containing protein [Spirochaetota bacterium]